MISSCMSSLMHAFMCSEYVAEKNYVNSIAREFDLYMCNLSSARVCAIMFVYSPD